MAEAFIKLYKKMLEWEWYDNPNTCRVFIHCLLRANWKPCKWHGQTIEAGQFITSLDTLADETALSVRQVRTALEHLISTGELTSKRQSKNRIITVNNWSEYQSVDKHNVNQKSIKRQSDDNQMTTDKEYKEKEEDKEGKELKNIYGEYRHVKLTDSEREKLFSEYGELETMEAIKFLDEYIEMKGYKAKSHYLALRKWVFNAVKESKERSNRQSTTIDWSSV